MMTPWKRLRTRRGGSGSFTGRHFIMSPGKPLRIRRGGGWVVGGEDACVALGGGATRAQGHDEGDASVPSPLHTTPAPTNVTICPSKSLPLKAGAVGALGLNTFQ
jgi:hypothetical protein